VNSSTLQLSLTPPIYRFDKSAQATTSLTPGALETTYRALFITLMLSWKAKNVCSGFA
jgi:hypothetical protein